MERVLVPVYVIGAVVTTLFLLARDIADFNGWNWLLIIPIDGFLGSIWPVYWAILHWTMG